MDYKEYWNEIKALAIQITEEADEYNEDITDLLYETIDGHEFVIYYHKAKRVLLWTDNEDAGFEDMGAGVLHGLESYSALVTRLAYYAMIADVSGHSNYGD